MKCKWDYAYTDVFSKFAVHIQWNPNKITLNFLWETLQDNLYVNMEG